MHRFRDIRRTEINDDVARTWVAIEKERPGCSRILKSFSNGGRFKPEIQKTGSGNIHRFTPVSDVEFCEHVGSDLARIEFANLCKADQGIGLVITELRIRARTNQDIGCVVVRKNGDDDGLEALLDEVVGEQERVTWLNRYKVTSSYVPRQLCNYVTHLTM